MCGQWVGGHCSSDCAEWWVVVVRKDKKDELLMGELASGVEHVCWLLRFGLDPLSVSHIRFCFKIMTGMVVKMYLLQKWMVGL